MKEVMIKSTKILAIESSCDDSAAAILDSRTGVLSNIVISQNELHSEFLGIVPEIASRSHLMNLKLAIERAIKESLVNISEIDAIAVCSGPGLVGSLILGVVYAKAISSVLNKPILEINHLEGHILSPQITEKIVYPYLALLISGGHSQFVLVKDFGDYDILGQTLDDALGECFDKVAKMLNLPFPGGPEIEKHAQLGEVERFSFPKPIFRSNDCNMSFSGLKTSIKILIKKQPEIDLKFIRDLAAGFQQTVAEILCKKTAHAIKIFEHYNKENNLRLETKQFIVTGGVACNNYITKYLTSFVKELGYDLIVPDKAFCRDNAAMIGFAAMERFKIMKFSDTFFEPKPRWNLENVNIQC